MATTVTSVVEPTAASLDGDRADIFGLPCVALCEKENDNRVYIAVLPKDWEQVGPPDGSTPIGERANAVVAEAFEKQALDLMHGKTRWSTVAIVYVPDNIARRGAQHWLNYVHFYCQAHDI